MIDSRAMRLAALGVWILVGVPVVMQGANTWQLMAQWSVAYLLFGILFFNDRLALASASIIVMVLLLCDGFEGALMVLIAMRLGSRVEGDRSEALVGGGDEERADRGLDDVEAEVDELQRESRLAKATVEVG